MSLWEYIVLFITVVIGGGIGLYLRRTERTVLRLVLAFSGAYILGITALHLMPVVFLEREAYIGIWILLGFFIQLMLEQLSWGVEHGHVHGHHHHRGFALQVMIGLSLHAFIEGMPLSNYAELHSLLHDHAEKAHHLLYGIILHKAPAAFALVVVLLSASYSSRKVIVCLLVFASMSPLGAFLAGQWPMDTNLVARLVAIVIGSFLHISTTILFEADDTHQHKISWKKMAAILGGLGISLLTIH